MCGLRDVSWQDYSSRSFIAVCYRFIRRRLNRRGVNLHHNGAAAINSMKRHHFQIIKMQSKYSKIKRDREKKRGNRLHKAAQSTCLYITIKHMFVCLFSCSISCVRGRNEAGHVQNKTNQTNEKIQQKKDNNKKQAGRNCGSDEIIIVPSGDMTAPSCLIPNIQCFLVILLL